MRNALLVALIIGVGIWCSCADRRLPAKSDEFLPPPTLIFVATNGNDAWSGRLAAPNAKGTDGPFATLPRALAEARNAKIREATNFQSILLRGGIYFLKEPIVLTPADSQLRIGASSGENVVLSGGRTITKWRDVTVNGRGYWAADVPQARGGLWFFRELWVNGERRTRARHPNKGYLGIESLPDATANWETGHSRFKYKKGDIEPWVTSTNAEVVALTRWVESRLPIMSIDPTQQIVNFRKRSVFELHAGDPYYVEHAFELLDEPGEWYLDDTYGILYYLPLDGERITDFEATAPIISQVLRLEGKPEAGEFVRNITFKGLTFANTEWSLARAGDPDAPAGWPAPTSIVGGFAQAAVGVPAAVHGEGVRYCEFQTCKFINLGTYGIELSRGCVSNRIAHCEFRDLGAGGIRIGERTVRTNEFERTWGNEVSDCTISEGGRMFQSAIGVWVGQSANNLITHNLIHDFYYTGISVGWTWGYGPALARGNLIEYNHVHHIGVQSDGDGPVLSDMGGIYTLGRQPGTRIINNLWHDVAGRFYGGWGIYFDEGSSGILAESNVVYRTTHGGFHQHYGETNILRNNIFAYARDHQLQRSREEDHVSFSFSNNIVLFNTGVLLGGVWADNHYIMDSNIYWDSRPEVHPEKMMFAGATWAQWQARGHDTNSLIMNPDFVPPAEEEFRLAPDSPGTNAGFRPIDVSRTGPRP